MMTPQFSMSLMCVMEGLLWAALMYVFWKRKHYKQFPVMGTYVGLHAITMVTSVPLVTLLLYKGLKPWGIRSFSVALFDVDFAVYVVSAILILFICLEIFRSALSQFPGFVRIGMLLFRWVAAVSVIVTVSIIAPHHIPYPQRFGEIAFGLMRTASVLELCVLAFLCLAIRALRLSFRDLSFGIALGFGFMACNEFLLSTMMTAHPSSPMTAPFQFVYEGVILFSLSLWLVYAVLPERARRPVILPVNSTIYRWNEIAAALGHHGTQVAVQQPAQGFFLSDVEKVVDKVLARNMQERESDI